MNHLYRHHLHPHAEPETARSYVFLREARFRSFHGVLPQERTVGGDFLVSVRAGLELSSAVDYDCLELTLNYAELYDVVKEEMAWSSQLLEHVAGRIAKAVFHRFPQVQTLDISVTKLNPPMGADCGGAGVQLHLINNKTHG